MEKPKVRKRASDERFLFLMDRQEGHPRCSAFTVTWHVSCHCLFWKGQKLLPHDKAITSSTPPELKHLSIFLSKTLMYFVVKRLGSHTAIGQGREKHLQQLKSTSQDLSSVQTSVREGCGLLPAGYPPYRLLQSHSHLF